MPRRIEPFESFCFNTNIDENGLQLDFSHLHPHKLCDLENRKFCGTKPQILNIGALNCKDCMHVLHELHVVTYDSDQNFCLCKILP